MCDTVGWTTPAFSCQPLWHAAIPLNSYAVGASVCTAQAGAGWQRWQGRRKVNRKKGMNGDSRLHAFPVCIIVVQLPSRDRPIAVTIVEKQWQCHDPSHDHMPESRAWRASAAASWAARLLVSQGLDKGRGEIQGPAQSKRRGQCPGHQRLDEGALQRARGRSMKRRIRV
jgi:hypothetical protein